MWRRGFWLLCMMVGWMGPAVASPVPWHLSGQHIEPHPAPAAIHSWGIEPGPHRVVVAVIDSGVLSAHPALQGRVLEGYDMQSPTQNRRGGRSGNYSPEPPHQHCAGLPVTSAYRTHGTEVASLIAGNGADGVWGVNPKALVLPIRIMGPCPMTREDIHDALLWAAGLPVTGAPLNPNPAQVINLSFAGGGLSCHAHTQALIDRVVAMGVVVVAAGGNNFGKPLQEPANCKGVISVGALNAVNELESYSALDARTSIYAPGGGPSLQGQAAWANNRLRVATEAPDLLGRPRLVAADRGIGTSFAAPLVSGLVSLVLSYQPGAQPAAMLSHLQDLSRRITVKGLPNCPCEGLGLYVGNRGAVQFVR